MGTTTLPPLGLAIDTEKRLFLLSPSRQASVMAAARALSTSASTAARRVPFQSFQRFTGNTVSCALDLPPARLYIRRIYAAQRSQPTTRSVKLVHGAMRDMPWWRHLASSTDVGRAL